MKIGSVRTITVCLSIMQLHVINQCSLLRCVCVLDFKILERVLGLYLIN